MYALRGLLGLVPYGTYTKGNIRQPLVHVLKKLRHFAVVVSPHHTYATQRQKTAEKESRILRGERDWQEVACGRKPATLRMARKFECP